MAKVKHWYGLLAAYNAIATKDDGTLYHVSDEQAIYRGTVCIVRSGNALNTTSTPQTKAGALTISGLLTANGGLSATTGAFSSYVLTSEVTLSTTYSSDLTSAGWYRVFVGTGYHNALSINLFLNINRFYNNTNNEAYTFSINGTYGGGLSITQLSGHYNTQIIPKIRIEYINSGLFAVDINYTGAVSNLVRVSGSGHGRLQAPVIVSSTTGTLQEYDTRIGFSTRSSAYVGGGITANGTVDLSYGGMTMTMGADSNASTRTNNTNKVARIGGYHYTNTEEPVGMLMMDSQSGNNFVRIGGGSSLFNAATYVKIYAAANGTTTTGTEIAQFTTTGLALFTNTPLGALDVSHGGMSLVLGADASAASRTNNTIKYARVGSAHYVNAEEPLGLIMGDSESGVNYVNLGGGSSLFNAATAVRTWAAADTITTVGTMITETTVTGLKVTFGTNNAPSADCVMLNGYGLMGNRSTLYITNYNSTGDIKFGINGVHNSVILMTLNSAGSLGVGTATPKGKISAQLGSLSAGISGIGSSWDSTYAVFGDAGSATGKAVGIGYDITNDNGALVCASPNVAWKNMRYFAAGHIWHIGANAKLTLDSNGSLTCGASATLQSWERICASASSGGVGLSARVGTKSFYLYNDGTTLKLDAFDYGPASALPFAIAQNGGTVSFGGGISVTGVGAFSSNLTVGGTLTVTGTVTASAFYEA